MKIKITVKDTKRNNQWDEEYTINDSYSPQEYAEDLIERFNKTLMAGESPREVVKVEIIEKGRTQEHVFTKQNHFTITDRYGIYDIMKCNICGVTGKRFGLSGNVKRDSKYKAKNIAIVTGT